MYCRAYNLSVQMKFLNPGLAIVYIYFFVSVLYRQILDGVEIGRLCTALETDSGIVEHSYKISDGEGGHSRLCIWNHPGCDMTGMIARSEKVAGTMEAVGVLQ